MLLRFLCTAMATAAVVSAADVKYSVVAFPGDGQSVAVSVDGQAHALAATQYPNLYSGSAPAPSDHYQYVLTSSSGSSQQVAESTTRKLAQGVSQTGNEFFNRSRTIYDVPALPQAFNPVYPPLFTGMNMSNEVATVILNANDTGIKAYLQNPKGDFGKIQVYNMTYITSNQIYTFQNVGIKTSGQSTKEFAKQSWKIDLNVKKFGSGGDNKQLLFGRTTLKFRAHETDPTFAREKLLLDCLAASGAATLSGSWARLFVNNEAFGLYLMIDDASTHFIDDVLHAGNYSYPYTGPVYKGNSLSDTEEADLVYKGDDPSLYSKDVYDPKDDGKADLNKTNEMEPLIGLMKRIQQNETVVDTKHTLIHMAFNFLSASWDGFWYQASNYYITQDLQSNQWTLITYDFDETFGNGIEDDSLITVPYQQFGPSGGNVSRPLQDQVLHGNEATMNEILTTVVKRFFKPSIIEPRLNAWTEMLREDIAWDRAIPAKSPGDARQWTLEDFETNMKNTTKDIVGLLEFITKRSAAVTQQLNITDADEGLPALEPYTQGKMGDGAAGSSSSNPGVNTGNNGNVTPGGGGGGADSSASFIHPFSTATMALLFSFGAYILL